MRDADSPLSSPTSLGGLADDLERVVQEATNSATWHVKCGPGHESHAGFETQEAAVEAACRLMDSGYAIVGVGRGPGDGGLDREQLAVAYATWVRVRHH